MPARSKTPPPAASIAPLTAPPLTDKTKPWCVARFTHFRDGKTHTFYSAVNEMTQHRLSAFDSAAPDLGDSVAWVRTVLRDIQKKATNVELIGTIKPSK